MKKNILQLERRRQFYNKIKKHPGLHLMELKKRINIPRSTLKYHINFLEKYDLIIVKKDRRYTRFFTKQKVGYEEKNNQYA